MATGSTILLVDDYPDALDVWELYLCSEGFKVLTAANGQDALAATVRLPDMVVLDLQLPDVSGFEVARELRATAATRHIPLIAATGYSTPFNSTKRADPVSTPWSSSHAIRTFWWPRFADCSPRPTSERSWLSNELFLAEG